MRGFLFRAEIAETYARKEKKLKPKRPRGARGQGEVRPSKKKTLAVQEEGFECVIAEGRDGKAKQKVRREDVDLDHHALCRRGGMRSGRVKGQVVPVARDQVDEIEGIAVASEEPKQRNAAEVSDKAVRCHGERDQHRESECRGEISVADHRC